MGINKIASIILLRELSLLSPYEDRIQFQVHKFAKFSSGFPGDQFSDLERKSKAMNTEEEQKNPSASFKVPEKLVKDVDGVRKWEKSEAYGEYLGFIKAVSESIFNKKIRDESRVLSDKVRLLMDILNRLSQWIDEIPPMSQEQRFGNKAFRTWHTRLKEKSSELLSSLLLEDEDCQNCIPELKVYLEEGFGNATRIDYGTGHEMAFVMFLCFLFKIEVFHQEDKEGVGLNVFDRYMSLVRKLQQTYRMEPAGSQGVWALDDYQFIPFIWGSAQFITNPRIKPKSIPDYEYAEMLHQDYHLFACVKYISTVKTGPFAEHSNQLWNISGVPSWEKVHQGLIKMYRAEVLNKFPVIQHVYFGSVFTLNESKTPIPAVLQISRPGPPTPTVFLKPS